MPLIQLLATSIDVTGLPKANADQNEVKTILQIVIGIVGAVAFLFIVVSGLRYVVSSGDPQSTAKAKNGVVYALVGLVLTLAAEAIVTWVVGQVG